MDAKERFPRIGIRWTMGDVSDAGFEALRLSVLSLHKLFGESARFAVCVNKVPVRLVERRVGALPVRVRWIRCEDNVPEWLRRHVDAQMAEGVAWKFAPVRVFPSLHELSLDNDVILWDLPSAIARWMDQSDACLLAADLQPALGQFSSICGNAVLNSGIRGLPPDFDYEEKLRELLTESDVCMRSELDEQGLQVATLLRHGKLIVVSTDDVSLCSPFPTHERRFGSCGAHFVGLNPKWMPWSIDGRPAHEAIRSLWRSRLPQLERLVYEAERMNCLTETALSDICD